jgi:hypothetical protein
MSVFRRLFSRDKPANQSRHGLAMVMLGDGATFSATAALDHLVERWSDLPSVAGRETGESVTTVSIPGGAAGMVHMPMPIPAGDIEGPVAVAWHWPGAAEAVAGHRSHVIVHVASSTLDLIEVRLLLTKLVASILAVTDGVGVYLGEAMLVRSAADFREDAANASRENLPLLSWIGFNLVNEETALSAYTTGLTGFGLHELEVSRSTLAAPELLGTLADLTNYQLTSGKVLRDGDTFGATELDRKRVRYRPSRFIPDLTVASLELS